MNKKFIYIFSIGTLLFMSSCKEDNLRLLPEIGTPYEEAINSEQDMKLVLAGVYTNMSSSSGFGAAVSIFGDLISDNTFVSNANDGYFLNTSRMTYSPEISDFGMMDSFYDVIQQANIVISDKKLPSSKTVLDYKAEAKIARALSYFYLVSFYSPDPKTGVNQEYGVPIQPEVYYPNDKLARASVGEVYDYIISDLQSAISQLGSEVEPKRKSVLTPTAAKMLLSRVYLTRGAAGDYQKSVDYSNEVINSSPSNFAPIDSKADYQNYFGGTSSAVMDDQPETIFEIEQTSLFNVGGNAHPATFYSNTGSHKSLLYRQTFVDTFEAADWRKSLFVTSGANQTPTGSGLDTPRGFYTKKWVRFTTDEGNYASNIRLMRFSEAYLNRIEAMFKMGSTAPALTYLNAFKSARGAAPVATITINEILNERRKEFFAEGFRYFDLKRNAMPIVKDSNCTDNCNVSADNRLFVIPIPYAEININSNMKQYPEW
ncbi:RagB/SusD family nutrient uptake outer membrane protein [Kaistella sp.]|uniref:RagB/SusD family nutrient uptake outer membrane protein n=1 Tax=Kaistella sp. TaxID=2782235 RepID=UPI003C4939F2